MKQALIRSPLAIRIVAFVVLGMMAGILGAGLIFQWAVMPRLNRLALEVSVSKSEIVPVERRAIASIYPSVFASRRLSPVLSIVRQGVATSPDIGSALVVTSDGWLATVSGVLVNRRLADVGVVWNGRIYPVTQAIRDRTTDAVFLKLEVRELPVTTFVRAQDVTPGMEVWVEPRARYVYPEMVVSVQGGRRTEVWPSERAVRRFIVSRSSEQGFGGGAVWDASGHIVGLIETMGADGWQVLPASDLSGALSSLLAIQEIRHAYLGIRVLDLTASSIAPNSPARTLLQEGDVIERVERDILDGRADLGERLLEYESGARITLHGRRKGEPFQAAVTLGMIVTSEKLK